MTRRTAARVALLPSLLFLLLFARSLPYEFVWTDHTELEQGLVIRPPGAILAALGEPMYRDVGAMPAGTTQPYYRPVKVVVASTVDLLFGREPAAFRAVNLALGAGAFALFAVLVNGLFRDPFVATVVAAVAAVHPAGIESAVWPSGLDEALARFFVVASLAATVWSVGRRSEGQAWAGGVVALGCLALGLGSKEGAVTTPALAAVCLLCAPHVAERRRTAFALLGAQVVVVVGFFFVLRPAVLGGFGAGASPAGGSYGVHLLTVIASWPDRLAWLFAPFESTTSDVVPRVESLLDPSLVLGLVLAVAAPLVSWRLWRLGYRLEALGWTWMWVAFLPMSGIVPLTHVRAERQMTLPVLGSAFFAATLVRVVSASARDERARRSLALVVAVATVGVLGWRTSVRVPDWQSDLSLFGADVARDPYYREGHFVLATTHAEAGRYEDAREALLALAAANDAFGSRVGFIRQEGATRLFCEVNLELGHETDTLELLGAQLAPDSPALEAAPALFLCGARSLEGTGRPREALALYRALYDAVGPDPRVVLGRARVHAALGHENTARIWLRRTPETVRDDPRYAEDRRALAIRLGLD